jgi:ABC-type lipoprotein release transport system permease subunit
MIVGDSMRGSLREQALGRLAGVDHALVTQRFFREALADEIAADPRFTDHFNHMSPVVLLRGSAVHAQKRTRADHVNILGVDDRFWALASPSPFQGADGGERGAGLPQRVLVINEPLALELGISVGDEVLLRTGKPSAIATETLLGRRDDAVSTLRLPVASVLSGHPLSMFSLTPSQAAPRNVYVPLAVLQRSLGQEAKVNGVLATRPQAAPDADQLDAVLKERLTLADVGIKWSIHEHQDYVSLESESVLVDPIVEEAAAGVVLSGVNLSFVLAYLANTIEKSDSTAAIPYSTVAAVDAGGPTFRSLAKLAQIEADRFDEDDILLNEWAAADLGVRAGDEITLTYYPPESAGTRTERATFRLRGVVPLRGTAADPGFVPAYEGITDVANLADWDPPFPVDLRRIRDKDEDYWDRHRTIPKAFVSLDAGSRLWGDRFGQVTSIRLHPVDQQELAALRDGFERELLDQLHLADLGFRWDAVRRRAIQASAGNTDFGMLFIGFSSFLIISAAMLAALLFRLNTERRADEIGLLLSLGFSPRSVSAVLVLEGLALAVVGGVWGILASAGYAWLMLAGLRSWWSSAVNAPFLRLHLSATTFCIGFAAGVIVAAGSMIWSVRGLARRAPRSLLAGAIQERSRSSLRRGADRVAGTFFLIAVAVAAYAAVGRGEKQALWFFLSGAAMMAAGLSALLIILRSDPQSIIHRPGAVSLVRLGLRGAPRNVQRSMLTAGLIASAAFVILSLQAFRMHPEQERDKGGGTGGFALLAESAVPLPYDLNTKKGRESLGVDDPVLDSIQVTAFRLRGGDEASCLNLYRPSEPRILGVPPELVERRGFRFAAGTRPSPPDLAWTVFRVRQADGTIAAIGDEAAVKWQLHSGLNQQLVIHDERGDEARLRFLALLKNSVLQNEILIADRDFMELFPSVSGHQFFLIEAPADRAAEVEAALERELERFGFDATPTTRRLAEFLAVQNTYLSTFQTLGGIGLMLGAAGLAAVMLRNIWERRSELALLQAIGFSRRAVAFVVLSENCALALSGLACAAVSAAMAVAPALVARAAPVPWASVALTFAGVLAVTCASGAVALRALRTKSVVQAIRRE